MSMQRIYNYGSFLQAYGLKKIIESLDAQVKFVDYHPGKPIISTERGTNLVRKLKKVFQTLKIKASIKSKLDYINYKRNYGKTIFPLLDLKSEKNFDTKNLDLLIIGSDEVFNCIQSNPNVGFSRDLFGVNSEAERLISYAASFGNTTLKKIKKYNKDQSIKKWINNFDALSVRDENSLDIIQSLTNKEVNINLDPVLIYDFMRYESIPNINVEYNYLILYGYNGRFSQAECKRIREFADKKELKILCIGGIQHYCDYFINCKPFEVLEYFKNAKYIITDTFHGTIMSIINHKRFATLIRNQGYGNSEKITDLLNRLNLNNQRLDTIDKLDTILNNKIDYLKVDNIISDERHKTLEYLKKQLVEVE
ncbi:polysaccharide pyruvyl transferase family protein [Lactobacillus sp. PV034]|nr:polysaccharide pyruvyl transferase family protein [Lactobacillus sp. PV034]